MGLRIGIYIRFPLNHQFTEASIGYKDTIAPDLQSNKKTLTDFTKLTPMGYTEKLFKPRISV